MILDDICDVILFCSVLVLQVMKREMAMKRYLKQFHETSRVDQDECGEMSAVAKSSSS